MSDPIYSRESWSDAALVSKCLNKKIVKAETAPLGAQMSNAVTCVLRVKYADDQEGADKLPTEFVLKLGVYTSNLGRHREAAFYANFSSVAAATSAEASSSSSSSQLFAKMHLPKAHFAQFQLVDENETHIERVVIVLDKVDGVDSGLFFGNHSPLNWKYASDAEIKPMLEAWGPNVSEKEVAIAAAQLAARLHAPMLGFNLRSDIQNADTAAASAAAPASPLRDPAFTHAACREWFQRALLDQQKPAASESDTAANSSSNKSNADSAAPPESWVSAMDFSKLKWIDEVKRCNEKAVDGQEEQPFGFSKYIVDLLHASFEKSTWARYSELLRTVPATLTHGDFHPANFIARRPRSEREPFSPDSLALIDWEMHRFGFGPQDVGQYLISHCRPAVRRLIERDVLQAYVDELDANTPKKDGTNLSKAKLMEHAQSEYVEGGVGRWLWFLPVLGVLCGGMPKMVTYFHDQTKDFCASHNVTTESVPAMRC